MNWEQIVAFAIGLEKYWETEYCLTFETTSGVDILYLPGIVMQDN